MNDKMEYRATGSRCAACIEDFGLPISHEDALTALTKLGFHLIHVDLILLARECIGASKYRRSARPSEAPSVVDCSSLMKWLYAQRGIWLPRRSIQQCKLGEEIALEKITAGDLVFRSGKINYYESDDPKNGVGHVGIATAERTVIHAVSGKLGIIESSLEEFTGTERFRGAKRYIPNDRLVLTFETPLGREVETADDIKWIILQSLPSRRRENS